MATLRLLAIGWELFAIGFFIGVKWVFDVGLALIFLAYPIWLFGLFRPNSKG